MAKRRMFSVAVVHSDEFLDMPPSSQALYFHLGLQADDDGFAAPKSVLRMVGAKEDDLKILQAKGFTIPFQSGVIVIKHWKENNYIRTDRYSPTVYRDEKKKLMVDGNVYRLSTTGIPNGSTGREVREIKQEGKKESFSFKKIEKPEILKKLDASQENL